MQLRLLIECIILFVGVPVILFATGSRLVMPVLILFGIAVLVYRYKLYGFSHLQHKHVNWDDLKFVLMRFSICAALLTLFVILFFPEKLLYLPRTNLTLSIMIALFYPVFSVVPQGIIYRWFFFERYAKVFPRHSRFLAAACLFALGHILFDHGIAVLFTFVGAFLFNQTYQKTQSLALSNFEHALYGVFIFLIGLGDFFYTGAQ